MKSFTFIACALVAAAASGCVTDEDTSDISQLSSGQLTAEPREIALGTVPVDTTVRGSVALINNGRTELVISRVRISPPDPGQPPPDPGQPPPEPGLPPPDPGTPPPEPGFPPDPCQVVAILPCIRPGDHTELTISCAFRAAGAIAYQADVHYSDGTASGLLSLPITGTVR